MDLSLNTDIVELRKSCYAMSSESTRKMFFDMLWRALIELIILFKIMILVRVSSGRPSIFFIKTSQDFACEDATAIKVCELEPTNTTYTTSASIVTAQAPRSLQLVFQTIICRKFAKISTKTRYPLFFAKDNKRSRGQPADARGAGGGDLASAARFI